MNIATKIVAASSASVDDKAQAIRDRLRDAIVGRRLAPSTKLSETEIGELFEVSRNVVRAALQMLAFEGLVRTERNRGAFVCNPSPEEAQQIFASRRVIEPGLVAAVAERIKPQQLTELKRRFGEHRHAGDTAARQAEIKQSGDFHLLLADIAGNAILKRFMEELIARSSLVIALYGRSSASSCGHADHLDILNALRQRDAKKASALMMQHINHIEADLDLRVREGLALKDALLARG